MIVNVILWRWRLYVFIFVLGYKIGLKWPVKDIYLTRYSAYHYQNNGSIISSAVIIPLHRTRAIDELRLFMTAGFPLLFLFCSDIQCVLSVARKALNVSFIFEKDTGMWWDGRNHTHMSFECSDIPGTRPIIKTVFPGRDFHYKDKTVYYILIRTVSSRTFQSVLYS